MKRSSSLTAFYVFLLLMALGIGAVIYWQHGTSRKVENEPGQNFQKHRLQITGFQFDGHRGGKRVITIKADQFTIEKGKMGPLRVSLWNVAKLKNGIIHLYGSSTSSSEVSSSKTDFGPSLGEEGEKPAVRRLELGDVFNKESIPSFGVKKVSSIISEPIQVILHDEASVVTEISAASATIRIKERDVFFKGNVRVLSGARTLLTETLSLDPVKGELRSEEQVLLQSPRQAVESKGMVTDFFLNIASPSRGKH